ncbi:MAG: hypothetical protein KGN79_12400 [Acidobacteriota bacterium]|nr:hypothetical protein [Acidobacteriota bacterium]
MTTVTPFKYPDACKALLETGSVRVPRNESNFMRTYTGKKFWPLDPRVSEIDVADIAHHLANECRFNGATRRHYSVAEHAVRVSYLAQHLVLKEARGKAAIHYARRVALWGLHHDDSEAYLRDLIRPIKNAPGLGSLYRMIERELMQEVIAAFALLPHEPSVVKEADTIISETEGRDLVKGYQVSPGVETLPYTIVPRSPQHAEEDFLTRHCALVNAIAIDEAE